MAGWFNDYIRIRLNEVEGRSNADVPPWNASGQAILQTLNLLQAIEQFNAAVNGDDGLEAGFSEERMYTSRTRRGGTVLHKEEHSISNTTIADALAADYSGNGEYSISFENEPQDLGIRGTIAVTPENVEKLQQAFLHAAQEAATLRRQLNRDGDLSDDDHARVEVRARQILRTDLGAIR